MTWLNKRAKGADYERRAKQLLQSSGVRIIASNVHCPHGELDIIGRDGDCLIFVEVRFRASKQFGGAAASVNRVKQQRLIASAQWFLQRHQQYQQLRCRFDVVAIDNEHSNWIKHAFNGA